MKENKRVEIITVRLSDPDRRQEIIDFFCDISNDLHENTGGFQCADLYVNTKNETDWSIYLHWENNAQGNSNTILGLSIAEFLSGYGLVNHSFWMKPNQREEHV